MKTIIEIKDGKVSAMSNDVDELVAVFNALCAKIEEKTSLSALRSLQFLGFNKREDFKSLKIEADISEETIKIEASGIAFDMYEAVLSNLSVLAGIDDVTELLKRIDKKNLENNVF